MPLVPVEPNNLPGAPAPIGANYGPTPAVVLTDGNGNILGGTAAVPTTVSASGAATFTAGTVSIGATAIVEAVAPAPGPQTYTLSVVSGGPVYIGPTAPSASTSTAGYPLTMTGAPLTLTTSGAIYAWVPAGVASVMAVLGQVAS